MVCCSCRHPSLTDPAAMVVTVRPPLTASTPACWAAYISPRQGPPVGTRAPGAAEGAGAGSTRCSRASRPWPSASRHPTVSSKLPTLGPSPRLVCAKLYLKANDINAAFAKLFLTSALLLILFLNTYH